MDTTTLVDEQIADGQLFIDQLNNAGIQVQIAFWVRTSDNDSCALYIASPIVDREGPAAAYRQVYAQLAKSAVRCVFRSDIRLVGIQDATATDAMSYRSHNLPTRFGGRKLGNLIIDEAYIYPDS